MNISCETSDLLVFSHLRWDFVFQRPQHLLSRHAKYRRVFYLEDPIFGMTELPRLHLRETTENVLVVIPYLPSHFKESEIASALSELVDELIYEEEIIDYTLMYYNPLALAYSQHLEPRAIIFDCMDEMTHSRESSETVTKFEEELMKKAHLVFTAGLTLYQAKKHLHKNIHPFPSSIDFHHFAQARGQLVEPDDQINIPRPRIGFYGVIDRRFNLELLLQMADLRPDYHFVIIGPVLRVDPRLLPRRGNIHYLGKKDYYALPLYLSGWNAAMMPFVLNDSTRYISPTKTPEYLAAGKPVVSTGISDIKPFANQGLVRVANNPEDFLDQLDLVMEECKLPEWLDRIDHYLKGNSWDRTFAKMAELELQLARSASQPQPILSYTINGTV